MVSIARKNLLHDKGRLTITLLGLAAALTLILFSLGMFIGTLDESVALIDHIDADLWVVGEGSRNILDPSAVPHRASNAIRRVEGVADLHRLIYSGLDVEKIDEQWQVMLVGYDLAHGVGAPWRMLSGDPAERWSSSPTISGSSGLPIGSCFWKTVWFNPSGRWSRHSPANPPRRPIRPHPPMSNPHFVTTLSQPRHSLCHSPWLY